MAGTSMPAREEGAAVERIGCDHRTVALLIDGHLLRWRCTHHHCPDAVEAKRRGLHAYHVLNVLTGEMLEPEFEEPRLRLAS